MKNLVSAQWLKDKMNDDNLVIFDCRFSLMDPEYGEKAYKEEHIVNSVYISLDKDLAGEKMEHGGRHPLPDMIEFSKFMEGFGVTNDSVIVIYDDGDLAGPSRFWWMLKYMGLDNVYILEGGIKAWKKENGDLTKEVKKSFESGTIKLNIKENMKCEMEYVKNSIGKSDIIIVDSRANERYLGIVEPIDKKAGHIPTAKNYDWTLNFKDGKILAEDQLKDRFKQLTNYKEVIVHCGSGVTGCANVLMLEEIGIESKLYVGSWSDWSSYDENPISTIDE